MIHNNQVIYKHRQKCQLLQKKSCRSYYVAVVLGTCVLLSPRIFPQKAPPQNLGYFLGPLLLLAICLLKIVLRVERFEKCQAVGEMANLMGRLERQKNSRAFQSRKRSLKSMGRKIC